jgi:hypothetical protein
MSLNKVYATGVKHALLNIQQNGGKVNGDVITIKTQQPVAVRFEKSFEGIYPAATIAASWNENKTALQFAFEGTGFAMRGEAAAWESSSPFVFHTELYIDGKLVESPELPVSYTTRRYDLCWKYDLPRGKHNVQLKILNSSGEYKVTPGTVIIYDNKPSDGIKANEKAARH